MSASSSLPTSPRGGPTPLNHRPEVEAGVLAEQFRELVRAFFRARR